MSGDILRGFGSLLRIIKAYRESVVFLDTVNGGAGRRQLEHVVSRGLGSDIDGRCRCNAGHGQLHAPVLQCVISVDRCCAVAHIVFRLIFDLIAVDAACGVDLIHRDLSAAHDVGAVNGKVTGQRADLADLPGQFAGISSCCSFTCACIRGISRRGSAAAAARDQAGCHGACQKHSHHFLHFHSFFLLTILLRRFNAESIELIYTLVFSRVKLTCPENEWI